MQEVKRRDEMHWCLGIRSSASTWVFNAVRKIAEVLCPGRPILGPYIVTYPQLPTFDNPNSLVIAKSHATDEDAASELSRRASAIWISIRDPRDCVASLVEYHGLDFDSALQDVERDARFCMRFIAHPRACVLRYEAGFFDNPATLDCIAAGFGGVLSSSDRVRIFAETRRATIEAFIRQIDGLPTAVRPAPNDLVDTVTKWHNHHANRTGEIGRWRRMLTPPEAATVEQHLADWMNSLGYRFGIAL